MQILTASHLTKPGTPMEELGEGLKECVFFNGMTPGVLTTLQGRLYIIENLANKN